jgi:GTP-binding protein
VVADVPGLIEGASEGKGLGHEFLRHIERTRVLIHMVDVSQETFEAMKHDYTMILDELFSYDKELIQRPRITVLSKMDALQNKEAFQEFCSFLQSQKVSYKEVSVAERQGLSELLENVVLILSKVLEASFLDKKVTGNPWEAPSYIGSEENGI